ACTVRLSFDFAADFADIFEVRGMRREARGTMLAAEVAPRRVLLGYRGLDGVERHAAVSWSEAPQRLSDERAEFDLTLAPHASHVLHARVDATARSRPVDGPAFEAARAGVAGAFTQAR